MPLYDNAAILIKANLEDIQAGRRARLVAIGRLTEDQLAAINEHRSRHHLPSITAEVVFIGKHIYRSRIVGDGYTIADVIDQIKSAMQTSSSFLESEKMTVLEVSVARLDNYGNLVKDRVVFECMTRHPRPELFSVIPKGDKNKPKR